MARLNDFLQQLDRDAGARARFEADPKEATANADLTDAAVNALVSREAAQVQQVLKAEGGGSIPPSLSAWFRVGP